MVFISSFNHNTSIILYTIHTPVQEHTESSKMIEEVKNADPADPFASLVRIVPRYKNGAPDEVLFAGGYKTSTLVGR